jgi:hypothetical protein
MTIVTHNYLDGLLRMWRLKLPNNPNYNDEVEVDVVSLIDVCGVMFGNCYMNIRDVVFMRRSNQHHLVNDGKYSSSICIVIFPISCW